MKSRTAFYWLLVSLAFTLTQPGAIAFANWDAPYGFYKDLSVWLSCAGAFLLLVTAYGIMLWRRGELHPINPFLTSVIAASTIWFGYWAEGFIRGEMGYGSSNILVFIIGGFIGLVLSLMLLPMAIPYALTGELYYPYDGPLIAAWLISLTVSVVLSVIYVKTRKGKGLKGRDSRAP